MYTAPQCIHLLYNTRLDGVLFLLCNSQQFMSSLHKKHLIFRQRKLIEKQTNERTNERFVTLFTLFLSTFPWRPDFAMGNRINGQHYKMNRKNYSHTYNSTSNSILEWYIQMWNTCAALPWWFKSTKRTNERTTKRSKSTAPIWTIKETFFGYYSFVNGLLFIDNPIMHLCNPFRSK